MLVGCWLIRFVLHTEAFLAHTTAGALLLLSVVPLLCVFLIITIDPLTALLEAGGFSLLPSTKRAAPPVAAAAVPA